jgi:hypothetical protein
VRLVHSLQQELHGQRECLEIFGASMCLRAYSGRDGRRIRSGDRYCPNTWNQSFNFFDSGATHSFVYVYIMFVRLSRLVVQTLETALAITNEESSKF